MRLTAEQFKQQYGEQSYNELQLLNGVANRPGFLERAKERITTAGEGVRSQLLGEEEGADDSVMNRASRATGAAATLLHTPVQVGYEALPEPARKGIAKVGDWIGGAINWLGEKLGNTKAVQGFVQKHPEAAKDLYEGAQVVGNVGQIAGDILAVGGGVRATQGTINTVQKGTAAVGRGVEAVGEGVAKIPGKIGETITKIGEREIAQPVQSALKGTKTGAFDEYVDTAKKAAQSNKGKTPLELAGEKAQGALDTIQRKLDTVGSQKRAVMDKASVGTTPVGPIVVKFRQRLTNFLKDKATVAGDSRLVQNVMAEAEKLGANPSAIQVDKFIDYVQEAIYTSKRDLTVPVTDATTGMLRQITGELNNSLKLKLPTSYSALNQKYSELIDTRNELNAKLGLEGEKGGALMKRVFSPSDGNTKKLFEEVLRITGVDLVNEATVAKFLMETLGDARQMSLLEQLKLPSLSGKNIAQMALDWISGKINTPEKIIERARELTNQ